MIGKTNNRFDQISALVLKKEELLRMSRELNKKTNQSPQSNSSPSILIGQYNYWANMEACGKLLKLLLYTDAILVFAVL